MQWGIFNNLTGMASDVPHVRLNQALVTDESAAFYFWRNTIRRMAGRETLLAITPDTNPVLHYHYHKSDAGLEYLFAFTKAHAYLWDGVSAWTLMFTCTLDCSTWSVENFGQYVVATNNLDLVQLWNDATPLVAFADMGSASGIQYDATHYLTKARVVIRHFSYLHLMGTTEDGTDYLNNDRWCDAGDLTSWREDHPTGGDANFRQLGPGDIIVGSGIYNVQGANQLITFTQHTVNAAWLVSDDLVYEGHDLLTATGCVGGESIVNAPDGNLYYVSTDDDGVLEVRKVYDVNTLSYDIQTILDNAHPTLSSAISGSYVGKFRQIWWSIPSSSSSTANDLVLVYSLETQTWQPTLAMDIQAFGYYTQQSALHIDDVTDLIDDVSETIDSFAPASGEPASICSDASGYSWELGTGVQDKGVAYNGLLVLALTFGDTLNQFKRVHGAWLFFTSYPGTTYTATVSLRKGDSAVYENLGSVSLSGDGKTVRQYIRFDKRMRDGHLKIVAENPCSFLGVVFHYDLRGMRL